jgi:phosphoglycerate dehydrogenase-like enzyme
VSQQIAPSVSFGLTTYNPHAEKDLGARRRTFEGVLAESNFISVHTPLLPATKSLINEAALRRMKKTAYLINSSRGPVVDQAALVRALQEGWIGGAGLDVFDPEPLPAASPLTTLDSVVLSPHMAAHTDEALLRMAMVVQDVMAVIEGRQPVSPVPPPA